MIAETDILVRMLIAAALGAVVGVERERQDQPAGMRTHIILTVGAALAMTLSINLAIMFRPLVPNGDPARLAAQVVSGIGFLGAGAILRHGTTVKGLTTATSLWTVAIVGLVVGAGLYLAAAGTTLLLLIVLTLLNTFEKRFIRSYSTHTVTVRAVDRPGLLDEVRELLNKGDQQVIDMGIFKDLEQNQITLDAVIKTIQEPDLSPLLEAIARIEGVKSFHIR